MKKSILFILLVGAASFQDSFAQKKTSALPEFQIKKSETEAHMRFLAADELAGRRTGEAGNFVAARYVAEQFRKLGLSPVTTNAGSNTASYFQNVPFEKMGASAAGEIIADAEIMKAGEAWLLMNGGETNLKAPIIYASFGLEDAAKSWDDYKGLDVKGKIVLVESGTPEAQTPTEIFATSNEKRKLAAAKGAIGIIECASALEYCFARLWRREIGTFAR